MLSVFVILDFHEFPIFTRANRFKQLFDVDSGKLVSVVRHPDRRPVGTGREGGCSTPFGITEGGTRVQDGVAFLQAVLNAFRHH